MSLHELMMVHPFENGTSHNNGVMEILSMIMNVVQHHHDVMTFCRTHDQWKGRKRFIMLRGKSNVSRIAVDLQSGLVRTDRDWDCQQTLGYNQSYVLLLFAGLMFLILPVSVTDYYYYLSIELCA
jgi:hypothetical protein